MKFSSIVAAFAGANMARAATQTASKLPPICNPSQLRVLENDLVVIRGEHASNCIPLTSLEDRMPKTVTDPKLDPFMCPMPLEEVKKRQKACDAARARDLEMESRYYEQSNCEPANRADEIKLDNNFMNCLKRYNLAEERVRQDMSTFFERESKRRKSGFITKDRIRGYTQTCLPRPPIVPFKVHPRPTGIIKRQRSSSQTPQPLARNLKPTATRDSSRAKPTQTRPMKITPAP